VDKRLNSNRAFNTVVTIGLVLFLMWKINSRMGNQGKGGAKGGRGGGLGGGMGGGPSTSAGRMTGGKERGALVRNFPTHHIPPP